MFAFRWCSYVTSTIGSLKSRRA